MSGIPLKRAGDVGAAPDGVLNLAKSSTVCRDGLAVLRPFLDCGASARMRIILSLLLVVGVAGCSRGGESLPEKTGPLPTVAQAPERGIGDFPQLDPARDWPWWRGPGRNGAAHAGAKPPIEFGDDKNVVWRTPVPGRGHSSPIVVGEKIYLTTADEAAQTQSVLAFERATGKPLWTTEISRGNFPAEIHRNNTHATPTMACDGRQLMVVMIHSKQVHVTWLDFDGKILRTQAVGPFYPQRYEFGYGPSPLLYKNLLIVASEFDGDSFLVALDTTTGKDVWRVSAQQHQFLVARRRSARRA
ncbi:MAG: PQQ-binding-like beta-propeller repeat protein [Pirellulales bacterium]